VKTIATDHKGYCRESRAVYAGRLKPGRAGDVIRCRGCDKPVKLRILPNGAIGWYVMVPAHKPPHPQWHVAEKRRQT
jgi:hypothetical protein